MPRSANQKGGYAYDSLFGLGCSFHRISGFMRRALVASIALGLGSGPVGVLLMLRRMSSVGDAMSHAVLPGAAIGFLIAGGVSLPAMGLGGLVAGLSVALLSGLVSRTTPLREDASFASFYLASLALGVLIVSLRGSNMDLLHVLFGTILAIDATALYLVGSIASLRFSSFLRWFIDRSSPSVSIRASCGPWVGEGRSITSSSFSLS